MGLFDYVRRYTSINMRRAPIRDGFRIRPWLDRPFGSFEFVVGLHSETVAPLLWPDFKWADNVKLKQPFPPAFLSWLASNAPAIA